MNKMKTGAFTYNDEQYNFNFKTSLPAYEKMIFVKTVVRNVVGEYDYDSIIKDLIFDFVVIQMFTNIDTSFIDMKDDNGDDIHPIILIEHFLKETNVVEIVKANMEIGLLDELNRAIDLDIQYLTGIHHNPLSEACASLVSTLEKKIEEVDLDGMMDMAKKFAGITGELTPESIIDAYIKSDMHQSNLAEIEEAKMQ